MESNLLCMRQFYETFRDAPQILSTLLREFKTTSFQLRHRQWQNHHGHIQLNVLDSLGSESEDKGQANEADFPKISQRFVISNKD